MNETSGSRFAAQPADAGSHPASSGVSLIDRESFFSGTYRTPHDMRIDGRYEGDIECSGTVFVGDTATVNARIIAGNVIIAGQFEGEVACETRFEILQTGRVSASVTASVTVVHEGAYYQGELRMVHPGAERPRPIQAEAARAPRPAATAAAPAGRPGAATRPGAAGGSDASASSGAHRRPTGPAVTGEEPEKPASLLATAGRINGAGNGRAPDAADAV